MQYHYFLVSHDTCHSIQIKLIHYRPKYNWLILHQKYLLDHFNQLKQNNFFV
jgi:hypothetical protein